MPGNVSPDSGMETEVGAERLDGSSPAPHYAREQDESA